MSKAKSSTIPWGFPHDLALDGHHLGVHFQPEKERLLTLAQN